MPNTKIATCCYCGTRAALILRGKERHELACSSCGAPLHEMKMLRAEPKPREDHDKRKYHGKSDRPSYKKKKYKKRRKSLRDFIFDEVFDTIEDIFD